MAHARRWRLAGLLLGVVLSIGCNPFMALFFLLPSDDPKRKAEEKRLASDDKNKVVKVVVVASNPTETRTEFLRVHHELGELLSRKLQEGCKANNEKVTLVPYNKVKGYMDDPAWIAEGPAGIGKHFDADYVIDLEIEQISLYEKGSGRNLYRGNGVIGVTLLDVSKEEPEVLLNSKTFEITYPDARGPIAADSMTPTKFRQDFLNRTATDLSWWFTAHLVSEHHHCD